MIGISCFLDSFLSKKEQNVRLISNRFTWKTPYNRTSIFTKRIGTSYFLDGFCPKKDQNVRFQTDFQRKPNIIERQFLKNVTVFYARYSVCCFNQFLVKKRTKREISGRNAGKYPYIRTTIFPKRNGFFMIDKSFV